VWTGTISPLPFARLTIQNDAHKLKHTKVKYAPQSCLHILSEERCLSFPDILHAEILCTSYYFKFKVLKQNTFTKKDIIKIGYFSCISMAPVVRNINISAAGHEKYFMHPFLYIWYIPEGSS